MELTEDFQQQARMVIDVLLNNAVRFIEEQPLGSYLPLWRLNSVLAGVGSGLNIKAISDRMTERRNTRSFYVIKGRSGPAGLLIVSAEAMESVNNAYGPRSPRDERSTPTTATPPTVKPAGPTLPLRAARTG